MNAFPKNMNRSTWTAYIEEWHGSTVVISCSGDIDMLTAPELQRRIAGALANSPTTLVIDLTKVDFLASHGMSVLVDTHYGVPAGTGFVVVADGPATSRPLTLCGLTRLFPVVATLQEALPIVSSARPPRGPR
jgi:anti-sigma B factor antagonist